MKELQAPASESEGIAMTDRKVMSSTETPEDVASLYSWANLHGAKYRDFSASRAQMREKARQRMQEAMELERQRAEQELEARKAEELRLAAEQAASEEHARAEEAARQAQIPVALPTIEPKGLRQTLPPLPASMREQAAPVRPAPTATPIELPAAPAWLSGERVTESFRQPSYRTEAYQPTPQMAPVETRPSAPATYPAPVTKPAPTQSSSRWFALHGVFGDSQGAGMAESQPATSQVPLLAIFSLAGGVGKTSLVATLGRVLSARGEKVLLVDTASFGLLPFYYGAREHRPGQLRTFTPPTANGEAPVQMIAIDPETLGPEETLAEEIGRLSQGTSRVIVDLATASSATTRKVLRMAPTVLVPVVPDMNSVVSVGAIESFFESHPDANGRVTRPYYLLNQFDASLPLHQEVRGMLGQQLGDRLLGMAVRRSQNVSEALAEGLTVIDYAPNSPAAEDIAGVADWVKSVVGPAGGSLRGMRWSER